MKYYLLKETTKYALIIALAMLIKVIIYKTYFDPNATGHLWINDLKYEDVLVEGEDYSFNKPVFNIDVLNDYVDDYIEENTCTNLEYNVYKFGNNSANIYLNCGNPKSTIYDYKNEEENGLEEYIKNKSTFEESVHRLIELKYPKFVSEEVDVLNGEYDMYENYLVAHYKTEDYGEVDIKVNYNEVRDLFSFEVTYDSEYENEKFVLDPNKKTISFTFDDGPSTYDLDIIDYLKDAHFTATFFLVGNRINNFKTSVEKMIECGMEIGNHSYDHKYLGNKSKSVVLNEIEKTDKIYNNLTGEHMALFRPPYGSVKNSYLVDANVPSILWSVDTMDWSSRDKDKVYNVIMNNVKDGDIVLMHSLYESTRDAVKMAIPELYKEGYQIVSVSKLAEMKGQELKAGSGYLSIR